MALLLSQLVLLPVLAVFTWMYLRLRPQERTRAMAWFDVVVVVLAVVFSLLGLLWADNTEIGRASPIWKPILSIITTFHIFPLILFIGWLLRRRLYGLEPGQ